MTPAEVWKEIQAATDDNRMFPQLARFNGIRLTKILADLRGREFRWLIGPYSQVRAMAQFLRTDSALQAELTQLRVRVGLRDTDRPPTTDHPVKGIGDWGPAANFDLSSVSRVTPGKPVARVTDLYEPVRRYWCARSLESHHIVEKGILRDLGLNKDDLADDRAPSVLLTAEYHQRLFTSEVASERGFFKDTKNHTAAAAYQQLTTIYDELYPRNSVLLPLRVAAGIINRAVRDNLAG